MDSDSDYETNRRTDTTTKVDKLSIHGVTLDVTAVSTFTHPSGCYCCHNTIVDDFFCPIKIKLLFSWLKRVFSIQMDSAIKTNTWTRSSKTYKSGMKTFEAQMKSTRSSLIFTVCTNSLKMDKSS